MSAQDTRFHLLPVSERYPLGELEQHAHQFLSKSDCSAPRLPPPNPDLRLVIVIPAFNEEAVIEKALSSFHSQSLSDEQCEVIVVDNGSNDSTQSVVVGFASRCKCPIHLITEPARGFLRALRTGMDVALNRLTQISPPQEGIIATIDADDYVGTQWAQAIVEMVTERHLDMVRGPTQMALPLPPQVELWVKALCDVENRVNGYVQLARLRLEEMLFGTGRRGWPLWLPRITGPNIAITKAAYVAVGGLDPHLPGDQASHLANPLLRMGGIVVQCDDPRMTLFRSDRRSRRVSDQAADFGVHGFGDILERAIYAVEEKVEISYRNPARIEAGLQHIMTELQSETDRTRKEAERLATRFLGSSPDPNLLYSYGVLPEEPTCVSLAEAREMLVRMVTRHDGIDYQIAERFLLGREHLRCAVLSSRDRIVDSDRIADTFLQKASHPFTSVPPHLKRITEVLKDLPKVGKERWYDKACRAMEEIYARVEL